MKNGGKGISIRLGPSFWGICRVYKEGRKKENKINVGLTVSSHCTKCREDKRFMTSHGV